MSRSSAPGQGEGRPTGEPPLVAIIDDDASVRKSTLRLIRSFGYRAEAFASGNEFLSSRLASGVACILLDVRMPDMDGLELQRRIVARHLDVPIVFISGRASDDEERRARATGAIEFLRKPISAATLLQVLQGILRRESRA